MSLAGSGAAPPTLSGDRPTVSTSLAVSGPGSVSGALSVGGNVVSSGWLVSSSANITGSAWIGGDLTVAGNASILGGNIVFINQQVLESEQLSVTNAGTGPCLLINQTGGSQPIANFMSNSGTVVSIQSGGLMRIGDGSAATERVDVVGNVNCSGFYKGNGLLLTGIPFSSITGVLNQTQIPYTAINSSLGYAPLPSTSFTYANIAGNITANHLPASGVTAATYGNASCYPSLVVDNYGRVTSASTFSLPTVQTMVLSSSCYGGAVPNGNPMVWGSASAAAYKAGASPSSIGIQGYGWTITSISSGTGLQNTSGQPQTILLHMIYDGSTNAYSSSWGVTWYRYSGSGSVQATNTLMWKDGNPCMLTLQVGDTFLVTNQTGSSFNAQVYLAITQVWVGTSGTSIY